MSLHRALVQYDRLFAEAESIRIERDKLRAENAELESENEHLNRCLTESTAQIHAFGWRISRLVAQEDKLKAENAELRKLIKPPVYAFTESEWKEWSAQHPILKEQPQEDIVQCRNCGAYLKEYDGEYCTKCSEDN